MQHVAKSAASLVNYLHKHMLLPCYVHLQVALVAGLVAVAVFIGQLGEPMVENTIKSFPTPADYEAYESR